MKNLIDLIKKEKTISVFDIPKGSNYKKLVSRKSALLFRCIWPLGVCDQKRYEKLMGYGHSFSPIYLESEVFYDFDELAKERATLLGLYSKDKNIFIKLANRCESEGAKLMKFTYQIKKKELLKLDDNKLKEIFSDYYNKVLDFDIFLMMPLSVQKFLEESADTELKKYNLDEEIFIDYHNTLCSPIKDNIGFFEQENILKLALKYKKEGMTDKLRSEIGKHVFNFGQIGCKCGIGNIWTEKDIIERIKFLAESNLDRRLADLENFTQEKENKVGQIFEKISASKSFIELVKITRTYVYLRTFRMDVISGSFANMTPLIEEIGKRNGLNRFEILNCFPGEIINGIDKKIPKIRENVVLKGLNGILYFTEGDEGKSVIENIEKHFLEGKEDSSGNGIKGTIANKGKVKGIVKVVKDNSELYKVKEGDIIVAFMTTPDFVPAMEKAAGFITNEGGILCHAAIVSREMNKPCIIGTKIATKVLKDGDLVEVDADKGIIKILK